MNLRNSLMGILLLAIVKCYAADDQWLGLFKGTMIPGHEV